MMNIPTPRIHRSQALILLIGTLLFTSTHAIRADLPVGANPPALDFPHFPDRLHAFVFRNWGLLAASRLAKTINATEPQITAIAHSMGLSDLTPPPARFHRQLYITIVRRNWHLLPYDQLLTLLDMTEQQLAFSLREDDFLFIKLGSLKPLCQPLKYRDPDETARAAAAQIKKELESQLGAILTQPREPRLAFIDRLGAPLPNAPRREPDPNEHPRFIYSYFGVFGDPLLDAKSNPYPDGLLDRLAAVGVNGVWLHVVLRQLAPGAPHFPEFGKDHEQRLKNLADLVNRARQRGISVYLYMNEPRAQPLDFFTRHQDVLGVKVGDHATMCTSTQKVRDWLADSLTHVFTHVPHLGGVFTITASENLTSCASRNHWKQCPHCKDRTDAQIIAEVNAVIEKGVHRANPKARVIAWDWGWAGHGDAPHHIAELPENIYIQSVSEWSKPITRGGVSTLVGEYSISAVGPGPRATRHWRLAKQRGLKTSAKVQLNATWELSALPFLPVLDLVADHCENLAKADVDALMLS